MPPAQNRALVTRKVEEGTSIAHIPPRPKGRTRLPAEFYGQDTWTICFVCRRNDTRSYCRLCGLGACDEPVCRMPHQLAQRTTMKASTCVGED